jgi:hypothetical protein
MSDPITIEITEVPVVDSPVDSSVVDSSVVDSLVDSSVVDSHVVDSSVVDSSVVDSSVVDSHVVDSSVVDSPVVDSSVVDSPVVDSSVVVKIPPITIEIIESPPNPIIELMKQHSKIALLIGLNYVDYPEITLKNRINGINNAKQILKNAYGFTDENILVLIEPSRENVLTMLNTIIGSSNLVSELIIYYSGYGNGIMKTDVGFCAE